VFALDYGRLMGVPYLPRKRLTQVKFLVRRMIDNVSAKRWGSQCALQVCAMQPGFHSPLHSLLGNRLGTRALPRCRGLDSPITTFVQPETLKMSLSACIHHPVNRFAMLAGAIAFLAPALAAAEFTLAPLPYASSALEPHIDARTMEIHHGRHHNAYVTNLNAQIKTFPDLEKMSLEQMQGQISKFNTAVRNNGGGHYNHDLFWKLMAPEGQRGKPGDALLGEITKTFGSLEEMKKRFDQAALGAFRLGLGLAHRDAGEEAAHHLDAQPGQPAHGSTRHRPRHADPRPGCLGARLLPQISEQARRIRHQLVERGQLGRGHPPLRRGDEVNLRRPPTEKG
jgi:hypothetical protein